VHHVVVERLCRCALQRFSEQIRSFENAEEAKEHAYEWAESMNGSYCGKHGFDVVEVGEHYVVSVEEGGFVESCEL
jgi:hypothetical protein